MLDEYKKSYEECANIVKDWKKLSPLELCSRYINAKENNSNYKATENSSYKKIPINTTPSYKKDLEYYNTLQNEEEKSVSNYNTFYDINPRKKQIHLNMPLLPLAKQIKYKNM